jgi:hypothetical protein
MLYSHVVKKLVRQSFEHVNNQRWDELLKAVAPNVHHRFAGADFGAVGVSSEDAHGVR